MVVLLLCLKHKVRDLILGHLGRWKPVEAEAPSLEMRPRGSVRVREGSLLSLSCEVSGDPPPSLTWYKISSSGSSQVIWTDIPRLIITFVSREDEGTYVCVASSLAGQVEDSLQVSLADKDDDKGEYISIRISLVLPVLPDQLNSPGSQLSKPP